MKGVGGMKKFLICMLTLLLMFSLVSCGGTDSAEIAEIGETVSTDRASFTLDRFEFSGIILSCHRIAVDVVDGQIEDMFCLPLAEDELQNLIEEDSSIRWIESNEGKVFATMSFTIENIGVEDLYEYIDDGNGSTTEIQGYIELQYGEYLFRCADGSYFNDYTADSDSDIDFWGLGDTLDIGVMEPPHKIRGFIPVPEQVMNDTSEPLYLNVYLPNESDDFEKFTYQLR